MRCLPFAIVAVMLGSAGGALAQSSPFDGLNSRGISSVDPALYDRQKAQWLARVQALPDNVDVLEGAADFFMIRDRALARELLEQASVLEPNNPKWFQRLAQLHRLNAAPGDVVEANLALSLMERAYSMDAGNSRTMLTHLPAMAFDAGNFRKARVYAERLLNEAKSHRGNWNYGNAIHQGNLILGRLAVGEGRIADAVTSLRAAGTTPGSPQLDSFGPNMSLAKDLLERGETDAVLEYLELCRAFWKMGGSRLDGWRQEVQAGRIPNFGVNLRY